MSRVLNDSVLVQDYVANRMSEDERQTFEARLLSDSDLLRDLEESLRLREGLEVLREQDALKDLRNPRRGSSRMGWAVAASLAIAALCLALYQTRRAPPVMVASAGILRSTSGAALDTARVYSFATSRRGTPIPDLPLPLSGALELRALVPGAAESADHTFGVTLERRDGADGMSRVGAAAHLVPDADGFVAVYLDAARLRPGSYSLVVEAGAKGAGRPTEDERFDFRLAAPSSK
jgi:hypothetical protein